MLLPCRRNRVKRRDGTGRVTTFRSFELNGRSAAHLAEGVQQLTAVAVGAAKAAAAPPAAALPAPAALQKHNGNLSPLLPAQASPVAGGLAKPALQAHQRPWHDRGSRRCAAKHAFRVDSSELVQAAKQVMESDRDAHVAEAAALLHAAGAGLLAGQVGGLIDEHHISPQQLLAAGTPLDEQAQQQQALALQQRLAALEQTQERPAPSPAGSTPGQQRALTPKQLLSVLQREAGGSEGGAAAQAGSTLSAFTPLEGVPERRLQLMPSASKPAAQHEAATAPAAAGSISSFAFTPMEGVPETMRGFGRTPAAPRWAVFTPVEGVPEKMSLGLTPHVRPMQLPGPASTAADCRAGSSGAGSAEGSSGLIVEQSAPIQQTGAVPPDYDDYDDGGGYGGDYYEDDEPPAGEQPKAQQPVQDAAAGSRQDAVGGSADMRPVATAQRGVGTRVQAVAVASSSSPRTPSDKLQINLVSGMTASQQQQLPLDRQQPPAQPGVNQRQQRQQESQTEPPLSGGDASVEGGLHQGPSAQEPSLQLTPGGMPAVTPGQSAGAAASLEVQPGEEEPAGDAAAPEAGTAGAGAAAARAGAGPSRRPKRPAQTPRELRTIKKRKSLAGAGTFVDEGGRRRSTRQAHKPLEYWRGEAKAYDRQAHKTMPTVTSYLERTPDPVWPAPDDKKRTKQTKQTKRSQK